MAAAMGAGSNRSRSTYVPPKAWSAVSAAEIGLSDKKLLLRFPSLFVAGDLSLLNLPAVAIVGSRKASPDGRRRAAQLAGTLARRGIAVMSGLAEGVDEAAHQGAIAAGGKTIAIIGTPLSSAYPAKHAELQRRIYTEHLLISPFPEGTRTFPSNFPERNRVMARLSRATVIVEASDKSGVLHQAAECEAAMHALFIAKSIKDDPKLTWPARFRTAITLESAEQIIAEISS